MPEPGRGIDNDSIAGSRKVQDSRDRYHRQERQGRQEAEGIPAVRRLIVLGISKKICQSVLGVLGALGGSFPRHWQEVARYIAVAQEKL